ncbi:MAG: thermonuclease family protein [Actinomycetota bacterium]
MPASPARRIAMTWGTRVAALAVVVLLAFLLLDDGAATPDPGAAPSDGRTAVVDCVYDGDTIRVTLDGESTRVRLLNIDAPEEPRDGEPGECLAGDATGFLEVLLPPGSEVALVHDEVRYDQYGRLLAGVYADGMLVNAELARAGLVRPVVFDGNTRFLAEVEDALEEAEDAGLGMFDPRANCPF